SENCSPSGPPPNSESPTSAFFQRGKTQKRPAVRISSAPRTSQCELQVRSVDDDRQRMNACAALYMRERTGEGKHLDLLIDPQEKPTTPVAGTIGLYSLSDDDNEGFILTLPAPARLSWWNLGGAHPAAPAARPP